MFEELGSQHRVEFIENRSDDGDRRRDGADGVRRCGRSRGGAAGGAARARDRSGCRRCSGRRLRALLGVRPRDGGRADEPDFVCVYGQATPRRGARPGSRRTPPPADSLVWVYVMNSHKRLTGAISPRRPPCAPAPSSELVDSRGISEPGAGGCRSRGGRPPDDRLRPDRRPGRHTRRSGSLGVITVDDVLELVVPKGWRRRFGLLGDD